MIKQVEFIPDKTIEEKAYKMLADYESRFGKIARPPVPIEKLIERHLDLQFDWDDIDDTDEMKILASLDPIEKKINMNARHQDHFETYIGSEPFTMAHEVGHWEMHVFQSGKAQLQLPLDDPPRPFLCRADTGDRRELQANKYAAYLLMPHHLLMQMIGDEDIYHFPNLYRLKDRFGVTIGAFTKRLTDLGLIYIGDDKKIYSSKEKFQGNLSMF